MFRILTDPITILTALAIATLSRLDVILQGFLIPAVQVGINFSFQTIKLSSKRTDIPLNFTVFNVYPPNRSGSRKSGEPIHRHERKETASVERATFLSL